MHAAGTLERAETDARDRFDTVYTLASILGGLNLAYNPPREGLTH